MKESFYVYIMASKENGTLYIGMTSNLPKRVWEHKNKVVKGFTEKYDVNKLVYYEVHDNAEAAIKRERRLKFWQRKWKLDLINKFNPLWEDLYDKVAQFCLSWILRSSRRMTIVKN